MFVKKAAPIDSNGPVSRVCESVSAYHRDGVAHAGFRVKTESAAADFGKAAETGRPFGHEKFKTEKSLPRYDNRMFSAKRKKSRRAAAAVQADICRFHQMTAHQ